MDNPKEDVITIFVPAKALEHPENGEQANLKMKLRYAAFRYYTNGDFSGPVGPHSFILQLQNFMFNQEPLGYHIIAKVIK